MRPAASDKTTSIRARQRSVAVHESAWILMGMPLPAATAPKHSCATTAKVKILHWGPSHVEIASPYRRSASVTTVSRRIPKYRNQDRIPSPTQRVEYTVYTAARYAGSPEAHTWASRHTPTVTAHSRQCGGTRSRSSKKHAPSLQSLSHESPTQRKRRLSRTPQTDTRPRNASNER